MAWTSVGFDGTINEAQWASLSGLLGNDYVAAGNGDCVVTAVGGARSVSVAAGSLYGDGVLSTNSGAETVAMTTPVNGQWYVIALRRTWATNTAALVAIAGATTTTTTPTAPPTSFPTLNTNKGVLTDQPIAWAWCNSSNTTVVVYDIRLKAVKSLPPVVANANERDAKFMTPTQGLQVWRDDLGLVQTYLNAYDASTNPGGRNSGGWFSNSRSEGLVPIRPTSVDKSGGTAAVNGLGVVEFSGVTYVSLNGVFTSEFKNYRININMTGSANPTVPGFRFRTNGTDYSGATYNYAGASARANGALGNWTANSNTLLDLGRINSNASSTYLEFYSPQENVWTEGTFMSSHVDNSGFLMAFVGAVIAASNQFDGFTFYASGGGTVSGAIQVLGFND